MIDALPPPPPLPVAIYFNNKSLPPTEPPYLRLQQCLADPVLESDRLYGEQAGSPSTRTDRALEIGNYTFGEPLNLDDPRELARATEILWAPLNATSSRSLDRYYPDLKTYLEVQPEAISRLYTNIALQIKEQMGTVVDKLLTGDQLTDVELGIVEFMIDLFTYASVDTNSPAAVSLAMVFSELNPSQKTAFINGLEVALQTYDLAQLQESDLDDLRQQLELAKIDFRRDHANSILGSMDDSTRRGVVFSPHRQIVHLPFPQMESPDDVQLLSFWRDLEVAMSQAYFIIPRTEVVMEKILGIPAVDIDYSNPSIKEQLKKVTRQQIVEAVVEVVIEDLFSGSEDDQKLKRLISNLPLLAQEAGVALTNHKPWINRGPYDIPLETIRELLSELPTERMRLSAAAVDLRFEANDLPTLLPGESGVLVMPPGSTITSATISRSYGKPILGSLSINITFVTPDNITQSWRLPLSASPGRAHASTDALQMLSQRALKEFWRSSYNSDNYIIGRTQAAIELITGDSFHIAPDTVSRIQDLLLELGGESTYSNWVVKATFTGESLATYAEQANELSMILAREARELYFITVISRESYDFSTIEKLYGRIDYLIQLSNKYALLADRLSSFEREWAERAYKETGIIHSDAFQNDSETQP